MQLADFPKLANTSNVRASKYLGGAHVADRSVSATRRTMLKVAGATSVGAVLAPVIASPGRATSSAAAEINELVASYLALRGQSATPGGRLLPRALMSSPVLKFERERAAYVRSLGQRFDWDGTMRSVASSAGRPVITDNGDNTWDVSFYETTDISWIPNPRSIDTFYLPLREADPRRYAPPASSSPVVTSSLGTTHATKLVRSTAGGLVVVSDAYSEPDVFGESPDFAASGLNPGFVQIEALEPQSVSVPGAVLVPDDPPYTVYDYVGAAQYAVQFALDYNANYVNYNCAGGDCANFVSQAFWSGGQLPAGNWNRIVTSSCGISNKYGGGHVQWYNNSNLRSWVINQSRGGNVGSISGLSRGDIVNYDWDGDGGTDHVAMMTDNVNNLVSCHNNDRKNVPWQLGGASSYKFTHLADQYYA